MLVSRIFTKRSDGALSSFGIARKSHYSFKSSSTVQNEISEHFALLSVMTRRDSRFNFPLRLLLNAIVGSFEEVIAQVGVILIRFESTDH